MRLSNFSFLEDGWPDLAELGASVEDVLYINPKATLQVRSTLAELLTRIIFEEENLTESAPSR